MRIGIDMGHTVSGVGYGAVGLVSESEETRRIGKPLIKYLQSLGHTVVDCTVDRATSVKDSLNKICSNANKHHLDLFVSIHLNASKDKKGEGVEVYTYAGKKLVQAERVLKNISDLGYRSRGIKDGSHLAVVRRTNAPAMLIECFFCDNEKDVSKYNVDKMIKAIAEGVTGKKISDANYQEANKNPPTDKTEGRNKVKIKKNGKIIEVDGFLQNDSNYVKVREVFEKLGHKVSWDNENKIVVVE